MPHMREVISDPLQTIRRTIRFEFTRRPDGSYIAYPKVLIETSAHPECRITSQAQYSQAFTSVGENPNIINDQGVSIPPDIGIPLAAMRRWKRNWRIPCVKNWANDQKARPADSIRQGIFFLNPPMTNTLHPPNNPSMNASYFAEKFAAALPYDRYVQTGTDEQRRRWKQVYDAAAITEPQKNLIGGFVRQMNLLIISGIWCGDCVQQCPLIARIAEANPVKISLRILDRDNIAIWPRRSASTPGIACRSPLLLAEDFEFCAAFGDRTINRYRALAQRYLGAACPTGIVGPDKEELNATLADWLAEIERVQLMLRLSQRLREKYGD